MSLCISHSSRAVIFVMSLWTQTHTQPFYSSLDLTRTTQVSLSWSSVIPKWR